MPINQKRELDDAVIKCIALDLRCFNDFRKEGMQELFFFYYNICDPNGIRLIEAKLKYFKHSYL